MQIQTPSLTRLRLDGILLCEAEYRCRDQRNGGITLMIEDTKEEGDRRDRAMRFRVDPVEADEIARWAAQTRLGLSGYQPLRGITG